MDDLEGFQLGLEYYHCGGLFGSLRRSVAKFLMVGFLDARRAFVEVTVSGIRIRGRMFASSNWIKAASVF